MEPVLELRNIAKTFVGQVALDGVDLTLYAGQICGLAGHNGSGKSTLIKILAGFHKPDPGSRGLIDGTSLEFVSVSTAHSLGLRFVHQELDLIDELDIFDNFFLTRSFSRPWGISMKNTAAPIAASFARSCMPTARFGITCKSITCCIGKACGQPHW